MQKTIFTPAAVSSIRIAVLPLFLYLYDAGNIVWCLGLFVIIIATDFIDGFLARKLKVASKVGAYYDSATDFALVMGIFTLFSFKGLYPVWLPILITMSYAQFLALSAVGKKLYDPVGKYTGTALYGGILLTLVFPSEAIFSFIE
jgi:phosphatidylglycerophosphate synthase